MIFSEGHYLALISETRDMFHIRELYGIKEFLSSLLRDV